MTELLLPTSLGGAGLCCGVAVSGVPGSQEIQVGHRSKDTDLVPSFLSGIFRCRSRTFSVIGIYQGSLLCGSPVSGRRQRNKSRFLRNAISKARTNLSHFTVISPDIRPQVLPAHPAGRRAQGGEGSRDTHSSLHSVPAGWWDLGAVIPRVAVSMSAGRTP